MTRAFIYMPSYENQSKKIGLDYNNDIEIENTILNNPEIGVVIQGTGGVKKFRIALVNTGKSGGARVVYVDFPIYGKVYLLAVFAKSVKETLTKSERNELFDLVKILEKEAKRGVKL